MFQAWSRKGAASPRPLKLPRVSPRKIAESCIEHGDPLPPALIDFVEPETGLDLLVPISVPSWGGLPVSGTGRLRVA